MAAKTVTVGQLQAQLGGLPPDTPVVFDDGYNIQGLPNVNVSLKDSPDGPVAVLSADMSDVEPLYEHGPAGLVHVS